MKKLFTYSLVAPAVMALTAFSASAATSLYGKLMPGLNADKVSNNGKWIGSQYDGIVVVSSADGATSWTYRGEKAELGMGNSVTDTGFAVGSNMDQAVYYLNGEMYDLIPEEPMLDKDGKPMLDDKGNPLMDNPYAIGNNSANAITPDGKRIVGYVPNLQNEKGFDGTMTAPCYWDVDADGKIGKTTLLPRPLTDWTNRSPQYVNATRISADGQVILGQVQDFQGAIGYPIVWTKNAEGEWEYSLPATSLINPNHVVIPEDPGEEPVQPEATDFMTDAQREQYQAAMDTWMETFDPDLYPVPTDYMSDEKKTEYQAAMDKYEINKAEFLEKYDAFAEAFNKAVDESTVLEYNRDILSADGKTAGMSAVQFGDWLEGTEDMYYPVLFDLTTGDIKKYPVTTDACLTTIGDNGDLLVSKAMTMFNPYPSQSYIIKKGTEEKIRLDKYFETAKPEFYTFMKEALVHPFSTEVENPDTGDWDTVVDEEYMFTGRVFANSAMTVYVGACESFFWSEDETAIPDYTSYVLDTEGTLSVEGIKADTAKASVNVKAVAAGALLVEGMADVTVYDLSGRAVFAAEGASGTVNAGLAAGTYVVKAIAADGTRSFKLAF